MFAITIIVDESGNWSLTPVSPKGPVTHGQVSHLLDVVREKWAEVAPAPVGAPVESEPVTAE